MKRLPEIIAHRGAPRDATENTLASFEIALSQGADGIELDDHATRDGTVVVHHDPAIEHVSGPARPPRAIASMTDVELALVRFADGQGVPTLDAVLTLVGRQATVYVEVKALSIEAQVASVLSRHPSVRAAVHSFDHRVAVAVRDVRPPTAIGLLSASYPVLMASCVTDASADAMWQHYELIDGALVRDTHQRGARLIAWTVNDPAAARALVEMGVDGICTDVPGLMREALSRVL